MSIDNQSPASETSEVGKITADLPLQEVIGRAHKLLGASGGATPLRFCFQWADIAFTVTPARSGAPAGTLAVEAFMGRLPYTAENAFARSAALKLTTPKKPGLPGRLRIDRRGLVHLIMETGATEAEGLAGILKEVTYLLLGNATQLKQLRGLLA